MIKAIIFDFFGVFRTDGYKAWLAANNLKREGGYFDASYQSDIGNYTGNQFFDRVSELFGQTVTKEDMDKTVSIDADVIAIAAALKKNYPIGLITNAPSDFVNQMIDENDLRQYFDEIVISSEVGMVKPNPDIFNYTLEKLGVTANEALFIDDTEINTVRASEMGIHAIHFVSAEQLKDDLLRLAINI